MSDNAFVVKRMTRSEVEHLVQWGITEGWNPGFYDADLLYKADPNGFFLGVLNGQPVGCICGLAIGETHGFMSFYVVDPAFRGQGYGIQIWNAAIEYLSGRIVGLDGVVAQQENYKKSGFQTAYTNYRYRGVGITATPSDHVIPLSEVPFEELVRYDSEMYYMPRPEFLRDWINQPECHALGVVQNGRLQGYGVLRKAFDGFKIGPLFADSEAVASDLYATLLSKASGEPVIIDIPGPNEASFAIAKRYGLSYLFEAARMYKSATPEIPLSRVFGATTLELG